MADPKECKHKGCGKKFTGENEPCVYHPGPPVFHEGHKGWKCCKTRVIDFDEFLAIPGCTTGTHTTVADPVPNTPAPPTIAPIPATDAPPQKAIDVYSVASNAQQSLGTAQPPPVEPKVDNINDDEDEPGMQIPKDAPCKRRGCQVKHTFEEQSQQECAFHSGVPIFHEGMKGWSCCKKRVTDFAEFLALPTCQQKSGHVFVGKRWLEKQSGQDHELLDTVRSEFYQTSTAIVASILLKKIDKAASSISFAAPRSVSLDLHTIAPPASSDQNGALPPARKQQYTAHWLLFGDILPDQCQFRITPSKLELTIVKADATGWPVLRATDPQTGEIIQSGAPQQYT